MFILIEMKIENKIESQSQKRSGFAEDSWIERRTSSPRTGLTTPHRSSRQMNEKRRKWLNKRQSVIADSRRWTTPEAIQRMMYKISKENF